MEGRPPARSVLSTDAFIGRNSCAVAAPARLDRLYSRVASLPVRFVINRPPRRRRQRRNDIAHGVAVPYTS